MAIPEGLADEGIWFRVEETSSASAARRAAERLAVQLGLGERRTADLAIVAAELTSNLVKHAEQGILLLRPTRDGSTAGVEMIAIDSGPGMTDLAQSVRDGHSTAGTLGIGLGSITRQATWYDGHTVPGRGTVLAVQVWAAHGPGPAWASGLTRPLTGESVSGDRYAVRISDGRHQVMVCDGLGHGPLAAAASAAAVRSFHNGPSVPPAALVEHLHRALNHTRGAALAVAEVDARVGVVRYAGLGNISGSVVDGENRRSMISLPGIAGHQRRLIREYDYPFPPAAVVVMHSDGVADRWQVADYPRLLERAPQVIAGTVLRDAGIRRDDACVLVAKASR